MLFYATFNNISVISRQSVLLVEETGEITDLLQVTDIQLGNVLYQQCINKLLYLFVGKGCVFSFDPVGSYERETYRAGGSASAMLQPLLDNQVSTG